MPEGERRVTFTRATKAGDGAGGKVQTGETVIASLVPANLRWHSSSHAIERTERGPGVQTIQTPFLILFKEDFPAGFPALRVNDLAAVQGVGSYKVLGIKGPPMYEDTMQIDVEVVS